MVGTVALVSPEERFVLIDVTSLIAASPGTDVITIADSRETSQMKISRERRNPFVIADLISGAPKVGERVFAVPAAASTLPHP